jgi:hypothetical protein
MSKLIDLGVEKYKCSKRADGKHLLEILEGTGPIVQVVCLNCNETFDIRKKL